MGFGCLQALLEKVTLPNGGSVLGGSSACWWTHNLMLSVVLYFFPEHLPLAERECEGKRNLVGSILAHVQLTPYWVIQHY